MMLSKSMEIQALLTIVCLYRRLDKLALIFSKIHSFFSFVSSVSSCVIDHNQFIESAASQMVNPSSKEDDEFSGIYRRVSRGA